MNHISNSEDLSVYCNLTNDGNYSNAEGPEIAKQELFQVKKQLERVNLLNEDLESEVERLHSHIQTLKNENSTNIEREKAEISVWATRLNNLQSEFDEERVKASSEIKDLKNKLESMKDVQTPQINSCELDQMKEDNAALQVQIEDLKLILGRNKDIINDLESQKNVLMNKIKDLEDNLEGTKNAFKSKNEDFKNISAALEELREEKALLSCELAILKGGTKEDCGRGNSLFGEVEDNRKKLESKLSLLHAKYLQSKKEISIKSKEIENLRVENMKLKRFWKDEEAILARKEMQIMNSYKQRIEELRKLVVKLEERPESPQVITVSEKDMSNMKWIDALIKEVREDNKLLRTELEKKATHLLVQEEQSYLLTIQIQKLKKELMNMESMYQESKNETHIKKNSEVPPEQPKTISKTLRFAENVEEIDGTSPKCEENSTESTNIESQ